MMRSGRISRREVLKKSSTVLGSLSVLPVAGAGTGNPARWEPESSRKIRMAVVGGGFGTDFQWHQHPNAVVAAVSDLREDRRERLKERYRCQHAYNSLEDLLKVARDLDAIAIFTEAPNHVRHVKLCLDHGLDVISAVPACVTLEEAEQLAEAVKRTGQTYMMAETSYFRHHCIAARELFQAGNFGELFYSEVEYYHPGIGHPGSPLSFFNGERTWRYGYPPMLYATHSTGLLVGVTDEHFSTVSCLGWGDPSNSGLGDNAYQNPFSSASALLKTSKGHQCRCNVFWDGKAEGERAQWFGTELTFYMPGSGGQPFRLEGESAPAWQSLPDYWGRIPPTLERNPGHGGSHPFLTHEFISALIEEREPAVGLREALAMTVPGIVAHQSAIAGGVQMTIPSYT
jgi:predicted dehydrogenase